ncbi:MAG TPA: DNA-binding domain-containing protein [Fodinibius sp.]|nr:DNA-binding domain-containing protein [Fodinibius sp.]
MSLEFYLVPNNMTAGSDDYMAISKNSVTYTIEDVYDHMTREGSTITKAEALAGYEEITQGIINLVATGNSVVTPLARYGSSIKGVFNGEEDHFDPNRHKVRVHISTGKRIKKVADNIPIKKVAVRERKPMLTYFYDNISQTRNNIITPERGARISGSLLKFNGDDAGQGVFFINIADGSETRVESRLLKNKPGELIFLSPDLAAGSYRLEVRSIIIDTTEIRIGVLSDELTVAASS